MKKKIIEAFSNFEDFDIPTAIFRALDSLFIAENIWWLGDKDQNLVSDCVRAKLYEMDNRLLTDFFFALADDHDDDGNSGFVYDLMKNVFKERLRNSEFYID